MPRPAVCRCLSCGVTTRYRMSLGVSRSVLNQALAWRRDDNLFPLILLIAMLGLVIAFVVVSLRTMRRSRR